MAPLVSIPNRPRRARYSASEGQVAFPFNFPVIEAADLDVRRFRGDVESELVLGGDYTVTGAGEQDGGNITLARGAQEGDLIVIRGAQAHARATVFNNGGDLRAEALLAEFNRQVIGLQQLYQQIQQGFRLAQSDPADLAEMPSRIGRANSVMGFGAAGEMVMVPRLSVGAGAAGFQQAGAGAVQRTQQDELARTIHPRQFGAAGDGTTDDTVAVQQAANYAASRGYSLALDDGVFMVSNTVTVPSAVAGIHMTGTLLYVGPDGLPAFVIGDGGAVKTQGKKMTGLRVKRLAISSWLDERDRGIVFKNVDACHIEIAEIYGFTVGAQFFGDASGCEDTNVHLGRIIDCRFGLDLHCSTAAGWCNSMRWFGGHFAVSSATWRTLPRYGIRTSCAPGAYDRHNAHAFYGPAFELQRQGTPGTVEAIPFLLAAGDERGIHAERVRMEACSPYVVKVDGNPNDCSFSPTYVGTYSFRGSRVLYASGTAKRAGVTVIPLPQAQAAQHSPRLFADASNLRAMAYRETSVSASGQGLTGGVGFDKMAVLSGNPNTLPTNLTGMAFPGLTLVDGSTSLLGADAVGLHSARAVAFVVDVSRCKEVFIAAEGEKLRPIVAQFDSAENILGEAYPVLFSNMNTLGRWTAESGNPPQWWEGNVNLDEPLNILAAGVVVETVQDINRLQRVRLHEAARYAIIGVRGGEAGAILRSLRLYCSPLHSPPLIYGANRAWGQRERTGTYDLDPPSLAAGAAWSTNVTLAGARHGDAVAAGFTQTSGYNALSGNITITASVTAPDSITVRLVNNHTAAIDLTAGTLYVQATKPRI